MLKTATRPIASADLYTLAIRAVPEIAQPLVAAQRTVDTIAAWGRVHAPLLLLAALLGLWLGTAKPAAALGLVSLCASALLHRGRWTPSGRWGVANRITALRLGLIASLAWLPAPPGPASALLALGVFALDGCDGWLARRGGEASLWGAHFDMESDALFVLLCTLLLYQSGRLGAFILVPGALRYLYALVVLFAPGAGGEAPPSRVPRYAYSLFVIGLMASLWPVPGHGLVAQLAALAVVASFGRSMYYSFRR